MRWRHHGNRNRRLSPICHSSVAERYGRVPSEASALTQATAFYSATSSMPSRMPANTASNLVGTLSLLRRFLIWLLTVCLLMPRYSAMRGVSQPRPIKRSTSSSLRLRGDASPRLSDTRVLSFAVVRSHVASSTFDCSPPNSTSDDFSSNKWTSIGLSPTPATAIGVMLTHLSSPDAQRILSRLGAGISPDRT